ncbi:hypothetical protein DKX38_017898 [Salix brachista]|uniref:Uncharacterized protein n=1 Tax=Salix brachista TaxID=2182728 RepID=A0A5N5KWX3_9ROSI|nr:hypothetical protein DKX38_017898 [Salix brachista]
MVRTRSEGREGEGEGEKLDGSIEFEDGRVRDGDSEEREEDGEVIRFLCSFASLLRKFSSSASIFEHFSPLLAWLPKEESKAAKLGDPEAKFEFHCGFSAQEMTFCANFVS